MQSHTMLATHSHAPTQRVSSVSTELNFESSIYVPSDSSPLDKIKIDPHKYLIFNYSKESEEWVSFVTLWNNDLDNSYKFTIDYNKKNDKECFIIRPRKTGHLVKQTGFGRKVVLKVTYDPRNDEPSIRHSKEKLGSDKRAEEKMQTFSVDRLEPINDTRRYFKLEISRLIARTGESEKYEPFRCQYLLPIFFHPQHTNTEVFVYPAKSITFNRNQGNQYSYWKNNFFIINNASQSVYFRILATKLPNNCDMVVFPTAGVVQHSFSDYTQQKKPHHKGASHLESDQDLSGKHYTVVSILLLDPEKAYLTHAAQKPIATIVMLYSYQKHIETDNLEELLQWASGKETIEIFVRDMSHNVAAKNNVIRDKRILELAQQNSMDQIYRLDNMTYQNVARQTRNALQSQFQKTGRGAAGSQVQNYGSYGSSGSPSHFIVGGNAKELISSSSLDHRIEEEDEYVSSVRDDAILSPANDSESGQFDGLSFDSAMSRRRQKGLEDAVRKVRNIAREQRITVTYGVSDSDIRRLIDRLQTRGVDAVQTDEDRN
uniref:CP2 domain-containing protein n=1 Tax=Macrostomum lignano TaxID=282301 RepID=A0A1I8I3F3_9PLAT